jgi:hypothetical protein
VAVAVNTTLQAYAHKLPFADSGITTAVYNIQAMTPTASPPGGTYNNDQDVTLTTTTPGAVIHFTNDGSMPNGGSPIYLSPIPVHGDGTNMTIRAIAVAGGLTDSPSSFDAYLIDYFDVAPPTFSPVAGTYTSAQTVIFSSTTPGVSFKYTTDGSNPNPGGTPGNSVTVNDTNPVTIKAYAFKGGMTDSTVSTAIYLIAPTIQSISPNNHTRNNNVSIHLHGTFFRPGVGQVTVQLKRGANTINAFNYTSITSTDIFCHVNISAPTQRALWNVVVTNTGGGTYTLVNGFRVR